MVQRIRVPCDVLELLQSLGDIDVVTDTAIQYALNGGFDIMACPRIDRGRPCKAVNINITNHEYLDYVATLGVHSNRLSVARLLAYLVDNGLYEQIPWPDTQTSMTRYTDRAYDRAIGALLHLHSLERERSRRDSVYNLVQQLREIYGGTDGLQNGDT